MPSTPAPALELAFDLHDETPLWPRHDPRWRQLNAAVTAIENGRGADLERWLDSYTARPIGGDS